MDGWWEEVMVLTFHLPLIYIYSNYDLGWYSKDIEQVLTYTDH